MHAAAVLPLLVLRPLLAAAALDADCPPASCGNLSIRYPFWLRGQQPSYCGYPSLGIDCDAAGAPPLLNGSYLRVLGIDYGNSSVVAFHTSLADDPTGCRATKFNVSSNLVLSIVSISRANWGLFLCSANCSRAPPAAGSLPMNCTDSGAPWFMYLSRSYENGGPVQETTASTGCQYSGVPVMPGSELRAMGDYERLVRRGFLLECTVPGDCAACEATGGQCRYDADMNAFRCLCNDGSRQPATCPSGVGDCAACNASGGQCRYDNNAEAFWCLCPGGRRAVSTCAGSNGTGRKIILIVLITVAASLLLPCICVLVWHRKGGKLHFFLCGKTSSSTETNIEALIASHGSLAPKRYKYSEVTKITSSLNDKLGEGGYGVVFQGRLDDSRLVAVKFLHDSKGEGEEFVNEVMSIGRTSHVNIVNLFGFCLEGSKRALIYEYMPNGSLDKYIYAENPKSILGWDKLYSIAIGIARGLEYLHHSCNTRIVHFDIKPQNILLDKDFRPKIADFGLAKLCHTKESKLSMTGARGTVGFIAPEVHSRTFGVVSTKSDVYSYGMMLLEMVGGRKNVNSVAQKSSEKYFPHWIYDHLGQGDGLQACEVSSENEGIAKKMSVIGMWCIQILPMHRPTITKVLEMFERGLDELDMPPRQNFSQILEDPSYNLNAESTSTSSGTKTQVSREELKMKELSIVNSKSLGRLPTL